MRMRDIAKAVGVSTMTVSRALRADASVAPATREAILQAVHDLGYVPDLAAGGLSSRRSRFVAILVPSLNNPHFSETVLGLSKRLDEAGLQLLIGDTDYRREREEALVHAFLSRKPEAIVLTPDGHTPRTLRLLADAGIPVIEIWEEPEQPVQHVVGFSNRRAMRALVESLAASGYRRMTFVGESDDEGTRGAARRWAIAMRSRRLGSVLHASVRWGALGHDVRWRKGARPRTRAFPRHGPRGLRLGPPCLRRRQRLPPARHRGPGGSRHRRVR